MYIVDKSTSYAIQKHILHMSQSFLLISFVDNARRRCIPVVNAKGKRGVWELVFGEGGLKFKQLIKALGNVQCLGDVGWETEIIHARCRENQDGQFYLKVICFELPVHYVIEFNPMLLSSSLCTMLLSSSSIAIPAMKQNDGLYWPSFLQTCINRAASPPSS